MQRRWRQFRIAAWALAGLGCVLILVRAFWPGVAVLGVAAAVFLVWQDWSRRSQERLTAMAQELDAHHRDA